VALRFGIPPPLGRGTACSLLRGSRHGLAFPFNGNGPVQILRSCGLPAEATGPHRLSSWPDWDATRVVGKWKKRGAPGVEKSAVSDSFIEASRDKLQELMERPLVELRLCTVRVNTGHIGLATFIAG
jgi:hypothetical protein